MKLFSDSMWFFCSVFSDSTALGVGLGIGLGVPILIGLIVLGVCLAKRKILVPVFHAPALFCIYIFVPH